MRWKKGQNLCYTRETFKQTIKSFEHVSDQIQEISAITEQMAASSQEINASIEDFAGLTRETGSGFKASGTINRSTSQIHGGHFLLHLLNGKAR